jgi:hypothetical protein
MRPAAAGHSIPLTSAIAPAAFHASACISRITVPEALRNWTRNCIVNAREDDRPRRPSPRRYSWAGAANRTSSASGPRYQGPSCGLSASRHRKRDPSPVARRATLVGNAVGQAHLTLAPGEPRRRPPRRASYHSPSCPRQIAAPPPIGGFFMTTNPDRSKCSTSRLATIAAIISPASFALLRPL